MHILIVSRCTPFPLYLGDRLILYHLLRELSGRGHTFDLLAFDDRPDIPDQRGQYADFVGHAEVFRAPLRSNGTLLGRIALPWMRFPKAAERAWSPEMWRAIAARRAAVTYDAAWLFGGIHVYEFARALAGLPCIITPYESYALYLKRASQAGSPGAGAAGLARFAAGSYEGFMFSRYRAAVVVSEPDRAEILSRWRGGDVRVIPNGIDLSAFPPPDDAPREDGLLLFTGNYEYGPNVDAALSLARDILPRVRQNYPAAHVELAGHAPPESLRALAGEQVRVTGRVPRIQDALYRAPVYVSPLRVGAGIKNKILEAMAAGCAVVATPLSMDGIDAAHEQHALIAEPDAMPEAISRVLADAALRARLAKNARALIESRYTWGVVATAYEKLFAEVTISP
ncbi:MAG: glycosyltransferase family 4 protein [Pleurocapsa minor GSE-CHR-MK-17-07R]|jgi:glycosyltransferase involved in cell wall biosynthesis|nr:glycosyltransferase family 4 protein [Pleurocapsa minor GSE-CHR-MK 17-07R]